MAAALIVSVVASGNARRRRAERDVERNFDLSLDLLCIAGLDGYFKRVNPAVPMTLGYSEEELRSRPFLDFAHPDDLQLSSEVFEALVRGEEAVQFENRTKCRDGSFRWLQWNTQPLPEEALLFCAARDVTDRRRAEAALRDGEERLRALLQESLAVATRTGAMKPSDLARVIVDTTVQAKNITFPTDAKLMNRAREKLVKLAKRLGVELRQSYTRVGKFELIKHQRYAHARQIQPRKQSPTQAQDVSWSRHPRYWTQDRWR